MIQHKRLALLTYAGLIIGMCVLALIQLEITPPVPAVPTLFGHHAVALFDLWIIGHFILGVIFAGAWHLATREAFEGPWYMARWFLLALASMCAWELIELLLELGFFGPAAAEWQHGVEHWSNRYVADIGLAVLGCIAYRYRPRIFWPTVVIGTLWLGMHLCLPNVMTLQRWLVASLL